MRLTIKQARKVADLTQDQVAAALGVHVQTYRKLEDKPEMATVAQAKKIAEITGISVESIFFCSQNELKVE